jgi:hypothetical protein
MEPSFQLFPHTWDRVARNTLRRGLLPAFPLLRAWATGGSLGDRAVRMVQAVSTSSPTVHVWGHGSEMEKYGLWGVLDEVMSFAGSLGLRPATNGELARLPRRT